MSNTAKKKTMKFQTEEALKNVQAIIDDADAALKDKARKISDSPFKRAIAGGVIGVSVAATILTGPLGLIPAAVAGATIASQKKKKTQNTKEILYKDAISKQTALIEALKEESNADKERIDYLNGLIKLLNATIKDLQHDLEMSNV